MTSILKKGTWIDDCYRVTRLLGSGGFGETYEVYDKRDATVKVLKLLKPEKAKFPNYLEYFHQEADILAEMQHVGIPSVDPEKDGYFIWRSSEHSKFLHCLVMEKVDGIDLKNEMAQRCRQPISQETALDWLEQLVQILQIIHQYNFFHRDIKPENIMIRSDTNEMVLIDFGIAREVSETYAEKKEDGRGITNAGTLGYRAPEVIRGEACPQSDFFSLGRTFVFLVTGQDIRSLNEDKAGNLIWRSQAVYISDSVKALLDRLMSQELQDRPANAQMLLDEIEQLRCEEQTAITPILSDSVEFHRIVIDRTATIFRRVGLSLLTGVLSSTLLASGVRSLGVLQPVELHVFDQMMRWRSTKPTQDDHILIVANTKEDYERYKQLPRSGGAFSSMSDESLFKLLEILNKSEASVIGLDIKWDFSTTNASLKKAFKENKKLYGVCGIEDSQGNNGFAAGDIPQVGFANTLQDPAGDKTIRRQLLVRNTRSNKCRVKDSFALNLALDYLDQQKIPLLDNKTCHAWVLGQTVLSLLKPPIGFYPSPEGGCQLLLNPSAGKDPRQNFEVVTLSEVLSNQVSKERIQGKIVLIGTTDPDFGDVIWTIPSQSNTKVAGLFVQAEMVSHLVDIGLGKRLPLQFWSLWQDTLWIAVWAFIGSTVSLRFRLGVGLIISTTFAVIALGLAGYFLLQKGILVAVVPAILAAFLSGSISCFTNHRLSKQVPISKLPARLSS